MSMFQSKSTNRHALIGLLCAVGIALSSYESLEYSGRSSGQKVAVFTFGSSDPAVQDVATELSDGVNALVRESSIMELMSESELRPDVNTSDNHHLWARNLSVSLIVEGYVRARDNDIQVTVQILDGTSDEHVWAKTFDTDRESIHIVAQEIDKKLLELVSRKLR